MSQNTENSFSFKSIVPIKGKNPCILYEHQIEAMQALDTINNQDSFRALLVLPTGSGKTLTAAYWLLKNAVDKGKKIIWIAHRHLLLEQAAEAFELNSYTNLLINVSGYSYRIVSGIHDKSASIKKDDSILFVSKDSIIRSLKSLDKWLSGEDVYLVVDEAHHSVAKSYRKIIDYVFEKANSVKLLGLTATPFRTADAEAGALKTIFTDDIVYKTDLDTLFKKEILAKPICQEYDTDILLGANIGIKALRSIEQLDVIPEDIADEISTNKERNRFIVEKYLENHEEYGQTIVFALNQKHAIALNALFNERGKKFGVKSDYIISGSRNADTGKGFTSDDNLKKIAKYREGKIQVLINVNILTEGTDLPQTHTVFLARPTISTVLMTQMIGRALRGPRAGGTKEAYIVSFIDDWNSKISWVNPEALTSADYIQLDDPVHKRENIIRMLSISAIEELALLADEAVDTSHLEGVPLIERIPLGMYTFSFIDTVDGHSMERYHQILVYSSTKSAYDNLIHNLPHIFKKHRIKDELLTDDQLKKLLDICSKYYFNRNMIPAYNPKDIEYLMKFYAQKEIAPLFVTFDDLDRKRLDLSTVAKRIHDEDMRRSEEAEYIQSLWDEEGSIFPIYYTNFYFFKKVIQSELDKISGDIPIVALRPQTLTEKKKTLSMSMQQLIDAYPQYGLELQEEVYTQHQNDNSDYICSICGKAYRTREDISIDYIKPLEAGGSTVADNLQLVCKKCRGNNR